MLIDVHSHMNDEKLIDDASAIIKRANDYHVERIICAGCDMETSESAIALAKKFENVYACIGLHPENIDKYSEGMLELILANYENEKVVAIGEIGLDYHYSPTNNDKLKQKDIFVEQLKIAHQLELPVVIHTRDAIGDTLEILKNNKNLLTNSGIVHCYSGSVETLKEIVKLGLKISIGGILTFKNARETLEVAREVGLEDFMFETDAPYLSPEPCRGKINEPRNVLYIAQKMADLKNLSLAEIEDISTRNAKQVFKKLK